MRINLLPRKKVKKRSPYFEQGVFGVVVIGGVLLILLGGWWYLQKNIEALNKKIAITQKELQRLKKNEEKIAELKKNTGILEQKVKIIEQLEKSKCGPVKILAEIASSSIPERMWLTNLRCQGSVLSLEGIAADNETIAQFMTNLENSSEFENVELKVVEGAKIEGYLLKKFALASVIKSFKSLEEVQTSSADKTPAKK